MPSTFARKSETSRRLQPQRLTKSRGLQPARPFALIRGTLLASALVLLTIGCAYVPNHYREEGPSTTMSWDSPTAADVKARYQPAEPRHRDWPTMTLAAEDGGVAHWPLYFEDPFEDKGDGRTDETDPYNVYRLGWEDWVAFPYSYARFTANWLLLPVSAVVTPPWVIMESDGYVSKQFLGYDHDAAPIYGTWLGAPTAAEGRAGQTPEAPVEPPPPIEPPSE